jgi:glycine cleavage system H protein
MNPNELLYAASHEWAHIAVENGVKVATVGISAFAVQQLNDLVYMDLPEVGKKLAVGDEFGEVESVKAVSPLYSPVAGEITAVNTDLPDHLERLGDDPYGSGWVIKVRLTDESALSQLMDFAAYEKQCAAEG